MKIVHVISSLELGGAQKIMLGLCKESIKKGITVHIISVLPDNQLIDELVSLNISVSTLSSENTINWYNIKNVNTITLKLVESLKWLRPDIIHTHLFLPKIFFLLCRKRIPAPIIETQHDNSPWWNKRRIKSFILTYIERRFAQDLSDISACISNSVREDFIHITKKDELRVVRIYNFIDTTPSKPDIANKLQEKLKCIYIISRLDMVKKGLDRVVEIAKKVCKNNDNVLFVVVGSGKDSEVLENLVLENKLGTYFKFVGRTRNVDQYYEKAYLVLMPSRWEGFGLTAAEAARAGVPVVASNVGGLKEVVIDGQTGFICDGNSISCFESKIQELLTSKETYTEMGLNAYNQSKSRFTLSDCFLQYFEIYENMVN
mgnify:CR=1 FL=1